MPVCGGGSLGWSLLLSPALAVGCLGTRMLCSETGHVKQTQERADSVFECEEDLLFHQGYLHTRWDDVWGFEAPRNSPEFKMPFDEFAVRCEEAEDSERRTSWDPYDPYGCLGSQGDKEVQDDWGKDKATEQAVDTGNGGRVAW